jgi:hypothetical protein
MRLCPRLCRLYTRQFTASYIEASARGCTVLDKNVRGNAAIELSADPTLMPVKYGGKVVTTCRAVIDENHAIPAT